MLFCGNVGKSRFARSFLESGGWVAEIVPTFTLFTTKQTNNLGNPNSRCWGNYFEFAFVWSDRFLFQINITFRR